MIHLNVIKVYKHYQYSPKTLKNYVDYETIHIFSKIGSKRLNQVSDFCNYSLFIKINLHNIKVYTNQGCLEEESILAGEYGIDVSVWLDCTNAALTNHLSLIADYILLEEIVYRDMAIASGLIETVAL